MKSIVYLILMFSVFNVSAQKDTLAVKSPEGIVNKMLELISVEKGEDPDWEEYRMLFTPNAQKMSVNPNAPTGRQVRAMNLEEFIRLAGPNYGRNGFEEYAIGMEVNEFNEIATVFQPFYCRTLDGSYEKRGVNAYQLVFADERWWITSVIFTNERDGAFLPNELLDEQYRK